MAASAQHLWPDGEPPAEFIESGVTVDTLEAVASRLSTTLDDVRSLKRQLSELSPRTRMYSSELDWLRRTPLLRLERPGPVQVYVVPSPWRLLESIQRTIWLDWVDALEMTSARGARIPPSVTRGEAFANYILKYFAATKGLENVDANESAQSKKPDLIWVGSEVGILIEAKVGLKPRSDPYLGEVGSVIETWNRIAEAIEQCAEYLQKNPEVRRRARRWVSVVATAEFDPEPSTNFKSILKRCRLLESTAPIEAVALLDLAGLEDWFLNGGPDALGLEIMSAWDRLDPSNTSLPQTVTRSGFDSRERPPHLSTAWRDLLGHDLPVPGEG